MTSIQYGDKCKDDKDCKSNVCEMTYDEHQNPKGRFCLEVNQKYGELCETNNDCPSGECIDILDEDNHFIERRCKADDYEYKDDKGGIYETTKFKHGIINDLQRQQIFEKHELGVLGKFIVKVSEAIIKVITNIIDLLKNIFMMVFKLIWKTILGTNKGDGPFGGIFFGLIHSKSKKTGKCLSMYWVRSFITILLPPFGVFLARGIMGFPYILLCSVLTLLFYFPGLIYAFAVINNSQCEIKDYIDEI